MGGFGRNFPGFLEYEYWAFSFPKEEDFLTLEELSSKEGF